MYGVTTKRFNDQTNRNLARIPADFMFRLSDTEHAAMRSQIATSIRGRSGRRYLPYVFTDHVRHSSRLPRQPYELVGTPGERFAPS